MNENEIMYKKNNKEEFLVICLPDIQCNITMYT